MGSVSAPDLSPVEHPTLKRVAPSTVWEMSTRWEIPDVEEMKCPQCGRVFKSLGGHWSKSSSCQHPPLTDHQRDLVVGLLMGDGSLSRQKGSNPFLRATMVEPRYLQHLDEQFGVLSNGVRLKRTSAEAARQMRGTGFRPDAVAKNYSDSYQWRSRNLPELHDFDWYEGGEKRWPDDIDLTPTVLKHWFAGDGHWNNSGSNDRISIGMSNEVEYTEKVDEMFQRADLPTPTRYDTSERRDGSMRCEAVFSVEDSYELFRYMGDPLPGFAYKWGHHETNTLKERLRGRDYRGPFAAVTLTDEELRKVPLEPRINVDGADKVTFHRQELERWVE